MAKYKVLKQFRDTHTKEVYKENDVIDLSDDRAAEVKENLKERGEFIELVEEKETFDREAAKERLTELGVDFKGNASNETLKQLLEELEEEGE